MLQQPPCRVSTCYCNSVLSVSTLALFFCRSHMPSLTLMQLTASYTTAVYFPCMCMEVFSC